MIPLDLPESTITPPQSRSGRLLLPIFAIVTSFLLSGLFILFTGTSPIAGYRDLLVAGFGCAGVGHCSLLTTLQFMTPLLLTGLSAAVAFRVGMFSIGQAGQMVFGAAAATWMVGVGDIASPVRIFFPILAGFLAGGIWGWIPGMLKMWLRVNEVITTLLFNQLALLITGALRTYRVPEEARLEILAKGTKLNSGILIAIGAALFLYLFFWHYQSGFEGRMAGNSMRFATYAGIPGRRAVLLGMLISGGLSGLAGAIEVLGVHYRFVSVFSGGGGFDGIAVAVLGGVHPLGVPVAAFLLAGLRLGSTNGLQLMARVPRELGGAIIAMMILLASSRRFYTLPLERGKNWLARLKSIRD